MTAARKPRRITEAKVEAHFVKRVRELGGIVRKVRWIGRRDAPDRRAMFPHGEIFAIDAPASLRKRWWPAGGRLQNFYAELKRPGEKARPSQLREHELMRAHGEHVVVLDSFEAVDKYLGFAS